MPIADAEVRGSSGSSKNVEATTESPWPVHSLEGLDVGEARIRVFHFFLGGEVTKVVNLTEGPNPKPVELCAAHRRPHLRPCHGPEDGKPLAGLFVRALKRVYALGKLE